MSETTLIHPDKGRAYTTTEYRLRYMSTDIALTISKRSERWPGFSNDTKLTAGVYHCLQSLRDPTARPVQRNRSSGLASSFGKAWGRHH